MIDPQRIGIVYNPHLAEAQPLATALARRLELKEDAWVCATDEMKEMEGLSLLITVGGDGTILRAVHLAAPAAVPILGVNMGRLGFMTELRASEALEQVPHYVKGDGRIEERAMVQGRVLRQKVGDGEQAPPPFHALNDVVVGRSLVARVVRIRTKVDGQELTIYRADAVVVSTATGSTGYALSAGGPILYPDSRDLLLTAVAPHLSLPFPLSLPSSAVVELTVLSDQPAMLSVDGYMDVTLSQGDTVQISSSPYTARFLRGHPPGYFFQTLTRRLGIGSEIPASGSTS